MTMAALPAASLAKSEEWTLLHSFTFDSDAWNLNGDNSTLANEDVLYPDKTDGTDSVRFIYAANDKTPFSNPSVDDDLVKGVSNTNGISKPGGKVLAAGNVTANNGATREIEVYKVPETAAAEDTTKIKLSYDFALHDMGTVGKKVSSYALKLTNTDGTVFYPFYLNIEKNLTNKKLYANNGSKSTQYSGKTIDFEKWYNAEVVIDFYNGILEAYLDGEQLTNALVPNTTFTFDNLKSISFVQSSSDWNDDYIFYDNISLSSSAIEKEPDSVVGVTLSRTPEDSAVISGTDIKYTAAVTDSLGRDIEAVDFYLDGELALTAENSPYEYTASDLTLGKHIVKAVARNSNGNEGSAENEISVSTFLTDSIYSSDMIFQRGKPIVIKGSGKNGEIITASFNGQTASCTAEHGRWEITLLPSDALKSADLVLTSSGGAALTLSNVAVGDVLLCSGQSNMDGTFSSFRQLESEMDKDYGDIRLLTSGDASGWKTATKENSYSFSALGYMIGKRVLSANPDVPIGVVKASVGGSAITAWTGNYAFNWDVDARSMFAAAKSSQSTHFYSRISSLRDMSFSAAVWYQGEGNTWYANNNYEKALVSLINNWRTVFEDDSLPFVIIQLPTANFSKIYNSSRIGIGVRAGQWNVSERLDNVKTIVSIDTGSTNNVHPQDKQPIADRAAAFVGDFINNSDSEIDSPSFDYMTKDADKLILHFKNTGGALKTDDEQSPLAFEIRNDSGEYSDAEAVINGDTIELNAAGIENPHVRYAWSDTPGIDKELVAAQTDTAAAVNLVNAKGLPMAPFKTDEKENYFYKDLSAKEDCYKYAPYISSLYEDEDGNIIIRAYDTDGVVEEVSVYVDDLFAGKAEKNADVWTFKPNVADGVHTVYAVAKDNDSLTTLSNEDGTYTVKRARRYDYVTGGYTSTVSVKELKSGSDILAYSENDADGEDAKVVCAAYGDEQKESLKLSASSAGKAVNTVVPFGSGENAQKNITIDVDMLFEGGDDGAVRATRYINAVTKNGNDIQLIYVTKTSIRVCGNFYELKGISNDKWYNIKVSVNPNEGTFSMWLDGVMQYDNQCFVYEAKDYEKNEYMYSRLKEGISAVKLTHVAASDNGGVENATYFDNLSISETAYVSDGSKYKILSINTENGIDVSIALPDVPSENAALYVAAYDESGMLIRVEKSSAQSENHFNAIDGAASYKAFVWDDMIPLCSAFEK